MKVSTNLPRGLAEALSWRVVAEFARRQPGLVVIETHQGGGQADCLTFLPRGAGTMERSISLNRGGSAHIHPFNGRGAYDTWGSFWDNYMHAADPKVVLERLEARAGLPTPLVLPPSSPSALAYRVIASVVTSAAFGRARVECRNGMLDGSGMGGGPREEFFAAFPAARAARVRRDDDVGGNADYRFWFIMVDGVPRLAFEPISGRVWTHDTEHDLLGVYRATGRVIGRTVAHVAAELLQ